MSDLISRQVAIDALEAKKDKSAKGDIGCFYNTIIQNNIDALKGLPSAKPERKTGRWISMTSYNNSYRCSVCGRMLINISDGKNMVTKNYPFCHCGAKMLKEGENIDS